MWYGCPPLPFPCSVFRLWPHLAWSEIHCQPSTWVMTKFWKRFFFPTFLCISIATFFPDGGDCCPSQPKFLRLTFPPPRKRQQKHRHDCPETEGEWLHEHQRSLRWPWRTFCLGRGWNWRQEYTSSRRGCGKKILREESWVGEHGWGNEEKTGSLDQPGLSCWIRKTSKDWPF